METPSRDRPRSNGTVSLVPLKLAFFLVPLGTAIVLFAPMLNASNQFFIDWVNSYWLTLEADPGIWPLWFFGPIDGLPALEPWFAYYGGNWFYLLAVFREVGADPLLTYRVSYLLLGLAMALGVYFLAVRAGVAVWAAALLATLALSIPYYLTNAYGRGAYTEFVFVSLLPVGVAACVAFYYATRMWQVVVSAVVAVVTVTLLLTTHMASLIMAFDIMLVIMSVSLLVFLTLSRSEKRVRILVYIRERWRSLVGVSILLSAAGLLAFPQTGVAVLTASGTLLAVTDGKCSVPELSTVSEVFAGGPRVSEISTTPDLKPQTATWVALWAAIATVLVYRLFTPQRRFVLVLSLALVVFSVAMTSSTWLCLTLPDFMVAFQFPYRFVSYVSFSILLVCGVLLSSNYLRHGSGIVRRLILSGFVAAVAVTTVGAFTQTRTAESYPEQADLRALSPYELPPTWYAPTGSFRQVGEFRPRESAKLLVFDQSSYNVVGRIRCTGSSRTILNVADSGALIRVSGVRRLGTSKDGLLVVDTSECANGELLPVTVEQASEQNPEREIILMALLVSMGLVVVALWLRRADQRLRVQ